MPRLYIGIDVQVRCPCAVVDAPGAVIDSHRFAAAEDGVAFLRPMAENYTLHIGIDAARVPIPRPRQWYWNGAKKTWRKKTASDKGLGRHCEVPTKAHNLANPQWTPSEANAPDWMQLGFELCRALDSISTTYEAFPSASYAMLENDPSLKLTVHFAAMRPGKTDMLDAWMAAATVRAFAEGHVMGSGNGVLGFQYLAFILISADGHLHCFTVFPSVSIALHKDPSAPPHRPAVLHANRPVCFSRCL